jgi:hypothetical protein
MQDTAIAATLRPVRPALVAACDQVIDRGWPESGRWWVHSPEYYVAAIKRELTLLETGDDSADHLARIGLFALMALHCRARGRR